MPTAFEGLIRQGPNLVRLKIMWMRQIARSRQLTFGVRIPDIFGAPY